MIPPAPPVKTPAQYGAVAPPRGDWPYNKAAPDHYGVNNLYPTVQGEGGQVGTPMVIVRLQGCPVGCVFCDTPESWEVAGPQVPAPQIADRVKALGLRWALVTGGEPTWYDLRALTVALHKSKIRTALETAGVYPITGQWDWVTVSPKPAGLIPFHPDALSHAHEVKWIVGRGGDIEDLDQFLQRWGGPKQGPRRVSLQPMSTARVATAACLDALMQHPDWHLSLQTHKMLGIA